MLLSSIHATPPLRIEYEETYYHVMNRGRGRQHIFHGEAYFKAFLATLEQANRRFGLQVLCYCLMPNYYHLLVKMPEANLGRVMQLAAKSRKRARYRSFVEMGIGEEITAFYDKEKQTPFLGNDGFRDWVIRQRQGDDKQMS